MAMLSELFREGDIPPDVPTDCFFKLEVTTLFVTSSAPFKLGNHLLEFFAFVDATPIKVRRHMFTMKMDVFEEMMTATLMTRVYGQGSGKYAIEFQRRGGDSLCFNNVYQKAARYLQPRLHFAATDPVPNFSFEPLPIPDGAFGIDVAELTSLLSMTGLIGAPWLQAEAAASLCKMASEENPVLWNDSVFKSIAELLDVSSTDVAHPTACLIGHLARQGQAIPHFADIWAKLVDKAAAPTTHPQVAKKLSGALREALQQHAQAVLVGDVPPVLLLEIEAALRCELPRDVAEHLEHSRALIFLGLQP